MHLLSFQFGKISSQFLLPDDYIVPKFAWQLFSAENHKIANSLTTTEARKN
jgi:hypothetical protein